MCSGWFAPHLGSILPLCQRKSHRSGLCCRQYVDGNYTLLAHPDAWVKGGDERGQGVRVVKRGSEVNGKGQGMRGDNDTIVLSI